MPDDASYLLCAEDAAGAAFFLDAGASTCTTAENDGYWCSGAADDEKESAAAASFIAELIGGEADYSPRSDYPDQLRSRSVDPAARADSVAWILKVTRLSDDLLGLDDMHICFCRVLLLL